MPLLQLFGPLAVQILTWLWQRLITNWKSSATGAAIGGAVYAGFQMFGCDPTLVQPAVLAAIAAAPKLLGSDADKIAPTIWQAMSDAVANQKKSADTIKQAQDEQSKWTPKP